MMEDQVRFLVDLVMALTFFIVYRAGRLDERRQWEQKAKAPEGGKEMG